MLDTDLAKSDREVIAESQNWPPDAVAICQAVEADYPEWSAYWARPVFPPRVQVGFYAKLRGASPAHHPGAYGLTEGTLRDAIQCSQEATRVASTQLRGYAVWYIAPGLATVQFQDYEPGFYAKPMRSDQPATHAETAVELVAALTSPREKG